MVTHDQDEAMSMADRIAVMDRGRIVQFGPPREIYDRPASRFVAPFVGAINLFEGRSCATPTVAEVESDDGCASVARAAQGRRAPACAAACVRRRWWWRGRRPGSPTNTAGTVRTSRTSAT